MSKSLIHQNSINFRPAKVCKGKEIRVEYYCRSPFDGSLKRYQIRLNFLKMTISDKIAYAENVAMNINSKLLNGWNPALDLESKNHYMSLSKAFHDFKRNRKDEIRPDTLRMYVSIWNVFSEWVQKNYKSELFVVQINKEVAAKYMKYLVLEREVGHTTHNNYLNGFKIIFGWMIIQGYHTFNPFAQIKKKKVAIKRRMYIKPQELQLISDHFIATDPNYYFLIMTSYMSILRRKEISMLKIQNILFEKSLLFVPGEISKNGKDHHITIPKKLLEIFKNMNLENYPKYYYVFSTRSLLPGPEKLQCKYISDRWAKMRKTLNIDSRIQFMSLRDTGIRHLVQNRVPLDDVMKHARHHSLEITKTYLLHDEVEANKNIINIDF